MADQTNILIVEDEKVLRELYTMILEDIDADNNVRPVVHEAASAEEALPLISQNRYDLVLTDFRLPGTNGIELIKKIHSVHPDTPALLISGFVDSALTRKALEAGAISCLKKPCSVDDLLAACSEAIQYQKKGRQPHNKHQQLSKRIAEILEANFINTLFVNEQFQIEFANTPFSNEYGDHLGKTCHRVIGGSAEICPDCQAASALQSGQPKTILRNGRSPEGERWKIEEKVEPWFDHEARCRGYIISFTPLLSFARSGPDKSPVKEKARIGNRLHITPLACLPKSQAIATITELSAQAIRKPQVDLVALSEMLSGLADRCERPPTVRAGIGAVVQPVLSRLSPLADSKGVRIELELQENLPHVEYSPPCLEQVFMNILVNALQACPPEKGRVKILSRTEKGYVEIAISDNGPGRESLECSLEYSIRKKGFGVGLAIAQKLTSEMGAKLEMENMLDCAKNKTGLCARIRFPLR